MSKEFTLTKEEFIKRSMNGEVFINREDRYFYDKGEYDPFMVNNSALDGAWSNFNGKTLFTLEEPKPIIERRWRWLSDTSKYTEVSARYYSDKESTMIGDGWYKKEDDYIDVGVKQ